MGPAQRTCSQPGSTLVSSEQCIPPTAQSRAFSGTSRCCRVEVEEEEEGPHGIGLSLPRRRT
eukprot:2126104-Rhodomonas_salina.1